MLKKIIKMNYGVIPNILDLISGISNIKIIAECISDKSKSSHLNNTHIDEMSSDEMSSDEMSSDEMSSEKYYDYFEMNGCEMY
jgi:hypothetical protein